MRIDASLCMAHMCASILAHRTWAIQCDCAEKANVLYNRKRSVYTLYKCASARIIFNFNEPIFPIIRNR